MSINPAHIPLVEKMTGTDLPYSKSNVWFDLKGEIRLLLTGAWSRKGQEVQASLVIDIETSNFFERDHYRGGFRRNA